MKMSILGMAATVGLLVSSLAHVAYAGGKYAAPATLDYDVLVGLPYNVRISYLEAFRSVLLEMDADHSETHAALDWMLNQILCSAEAHPNDPFCINLGVVQEASACPAEFHDFDTGKYLQGIGLTTADPVCAGGGMPCSPYFGFDQSGNLFCSKGHRTKSCEKESAGKTTLQFADVLKKCALQGSSTAKINCDKLPSFMATQQAVVEQYCKQSHRACGILRDQAERDGKMFTDMNADSNEEQVAKITAYLHQVNTTRPVTGPSAECPPGNAPASQPAAATAPAPAQAPAPAPPGQQIAAADGLTPPAEVKHQDCSDKRDMKGTYIEGDQDFKEIWAAAFPQGSTVGCVQFKTPSGYLFTLNKTAMGLQSNGLVEFPPGADGKPSRPPVSLDLHSFLIMKALSQTFETNSFGFNPANLLKTYLPVTPIKPSGVLKDGDKYYPAVEYTTEDGTTIRYTEGEDGQFVTMKPKGGVESQEFNFRIRVAK